MKTRILILASVAALSLAAVAYAGTNRFSKSLRGGGTVSFKVKTNKRGTATKVTSIKVKDLPVACVNPDGPTTPVPPVSASLGKVKVTQNLGTYRFNLNKRVSGRSWKFQGAFSSRKGRKVSEGQVVVNFATPDGAVACGKTVQFKAKRK